MADLKTDLAECVRLAGKATTGKWRVVMAHNATGEWPEIVAHGFKAVATPYGDSAENGAAIAGRAGG